jgi:FkbM family methyltransferase
MFKNWNQTVNSVRRFSKLLVKKTILACFRAFPRISFFLISKCGGKSVMRDILRGWIIRQQIEKFESVLELVKYPNQILIDRAGCFVNTDDIFVNTTLVDRYFMYEGNVPYHGEGKQFFERLQRYPIKLEQFVDLGANFGEFSIWFAKHTNARVLAVEPSTENLRVFESNVLQNHLDRSRITLIRKAIADFNGHVAITVGHSQGNTIIGAKGRTETVECTRLGQCLADHGITHINVLKIDMEGAEPLLRADLEEWLPRIDCVLIEMGGIFNAAESYDPLIDLFFAQDFICEFYADGMRLSAVEIKKSIRSSGFWGDYLFVKKTFVKN